MKFQKLNQKALSFFMSGLFTITLAVSESKDFAVLALDNTTSISSSIDTSTKVKIFLYILFRLNFSFYLV